MSENIQSATLSRSTARQLSTTTKTTPVMGSISPRWLLKLLPWVAVTAGTYRVNKRKVLVKSPGKLSIESDRLAPEHLTQLDIFNNVAGDLLGALASKFATKTYSQGQQIIKEGDKGDTFYLIASGKVEVNRQGQQGEKMVLAVLGAGDYFGESVLFNESPRSANVIALVPTSVFMLDRAQFNKQLKDSAVFRNIVEDAVKERNHRRSITNDEGEAPANVEVNNDLVRTIVASFIDYEDNPKEYSLSVLQAILKVPTVISDIYNAPYDQVEEQVRLMIEEMKERQEWEVINNPEFGLLAQVAASQRILPRKGAPTPDDMDQLLTKVWKKPAFFLAHPKAIAAFGRECTRRGVPPATVNIFGTPVITWRGVPIIPSNKIAISDGADGRIEGSTSILLMRVGEKEQGVVGLHQPGIPNERIPSLSVLFNGVTPDAHRNYLMSLYYSCAVLSDDAIAVLENVQISNFYDY